MQMLVARFGGDETGERHTEELRRTLRYMEEPRMLAETVTQWRQEALDEGRRQGLSHERALLRRQATRRFDNATGDALAALLANEEDVERLEEVGDLGSAARARRNCYGAAEVCSTAASSHSSALDRLHGAASSPLGRVAPPSTAVRRCTGDALLANEADVERLVDAGGLVIGC